MPKQPQAAFESVFAFPPNRDTLGGTAYLIVENDRAGAGNVLIDSPPWNEETQSFLERHGGIRAWVLTHRGAIAPLKTVREIVEATGCQPTIQEQEAYLLADVPRHTFQHEQILGDRVRVIWTPGHSPGSSCVYFRDRGGILFSGRHLLPTPQGHIGPAHTANTFHWWRQLRSIAHLRQTLGEDSLAYICPGARVGFLRGRHWVDRAWERLAAIDLEAAKLDPLQAVSAPIP
ncbi:MAG: MBL fold metallo-hydrolase [Cyanophyceae cyanobacterium]